MSRADGTGTCDVPGCNEPIRYWGIEWAYCVPKWSRTSNGKSVLSEAHKHLEGES